MLLSTYVTVFMQTCTKPAQGEIYYILFLESHSVPSLQSQPAQVKWQINHPVISAQAGNEGP